MAKLFYTLQEAAQKMGKSEDDVKEMVVNGQLQEFRDRDRLMFKVDQVDLLGGGDDDMIALAESSEMDVISLAGSGTGMEMGQETKEETGVSIFDADETEEADPSAVTQITETAADFSAIETLGGSGSGLLDMTQEADDTSLGADLLEGVYTGDESTPVAPAEGDLFETSGAQTDTAGAGVPAMIGAAAAPYDGPGSGLAGGLALAMILSLAGSLAIIIPSLTGDAGPLLEAIPRNPMMVLGAGGGAIIVLGGIGMLLGKKSR